MLFLCVNVYCHRVTTQLQLISIIIIYIYSLLHTNIYIYILGFKLSPFFECCILFLGYSAASEFYVLTFRNTLSIPSS